MTLSIDFTTLFDTPEPMPETSLDVALAEYDAWLCNASGDAEYSVVELPFYRETMEEIECRV